MNDTTEAPTIDPTGKLAKASLVAVGAGAGAATSAITALIEAVAKRTAKAAFFLSIFGVIGEIKV